MTLTIIFEGGSLIYEHTSFLSATITLGHITHTIGPRIVNTNGIDFIYSWNSESIN